MKALVTGGGGFLGGAIVRKLLEEVNLLPSSICYVDDNPVEREWIEMACPEVYTIPESDPLEMLRSLSVTRLFDSLSVTAEDRLRTGSYAAMEARKRLQEDKADLAEFLHSLQIMKEIPCV